MATLSGACAGAPRTPQKVHVQAARYLASSVLALACDTAIYLALGIAGMVPALAAAAGYLAGLALHYMLSIHFVFDVEATGKGHRRLVLEFALSGMGGLGLTMLIIAVATGPLGLALLPAKVLAVGASFVAVFLVRRGLVFVRADG